MAGGVIHAAWVQAAPIWVTAALAGVGLNTWRQQQRGQRQLEHSEKALANGKAAFTITRSIRIRLVTYSVEDASDPIRRELAYQQLIIERLNRAWTAWTKFADDYFLANLFQNPNSARSDVAAELADCISSLESNAEMMFIYQGYVKDSPGDTTFRADLIKFRQAFYGVSQQGSSDEIGTRLDKSEAELEAQMRPILVFDSVLNKLKRKILLKGKRS